MYLHARGDSKNKENDGDNYFEDVHSHVALDTEGETREV